MVLAHKYMRGSLEQGVELHVGFFESALEHAPVEVVGIEHAYLAAETAHVFDDFRRGAFAQHQVVLIACARFGHIHERLHAEGVMLRGNGQSHVGRTMFGIAALKHVGLLDYLARVTQKLGAVVGQRHAAIAARENGDAQLLLEVFDGRGQVRLRRKQLARGGVDGAVFRDGDKVAKLLQCGHGGFSLYEFGFMPTNMSNRILPRRAL